MVICKEEITSESNKEAMEENGAMVSMAATQWPKQSGTVLFQRNRSLCVSFFRDFQGVKILCSYIIKISTPNLEEKKKKNNINIYEIKVHIYGIRTKKLNINIYIIFYIWYQNQEIDINIYEIKVH